MSAATRPSQLRRRLVLPVAIAAIAAIATPAGAATIVGSDADDVLLGTPGADLLRGLAGNDGLRGGAGADVLDGGAGGDALAGGSGRDAVVYSGSGPIVVTLDDLANDGAPNERDNVQTDVEDVFATPGDDVLVGSAGSESLDGGAGADRLDGRGGADELFGGSGDDRIDARDGRLDRVVCGDGSDAAVVDERDRTRDCELIDRRPVVPRVDATLSYEWRAVGPRTAYPVLRLTDVSPARAAVELECSGTGCPFARRRLPGRRRLELTSVLRRFVASPGTRLDIRLTTPGHTGKLIRLVARRHDAPLKQERCLRGREQRPAVRCF